MALTKISGSILKDPLNLGGVSIGGTLTYQDVTNVDSVGLGTFRSGINVSGGQLDVGSNVKIGNSGVATATNFKTGSSNLHSTGLTVGNNFLHSTGINVGTGATIHVPATNTLTLGTNSAERLRINSGGKILIGHTSARGVGGSQFRQLQIEGTAGESAISIVRNSANTSGAGINLGKSRSSSVGGSTIVQDDDKLGVISFSGADGVDLQAIAAQITGEVDGTPGENDMPGRIVFKTTADGSSSTTERARITSTGNVGINDTDPSYKLNVIGDNTAHNGIGMLKGIIGVQNDTTAFGSSPTAGISFQTKYRTGPDVPLDVAAIWGGKENSTNGDKDGYMGFATREEGGSGDQERMRITSGGQILIGTTSALSFNGVGQYHNLIVAGSTSDTDITDNSYAAITISNKDGTANNTAGLHFAREDTDGNPHYDGASIVAQFKETMNTGQYPKTDLAFLVSPANNNAPQEKMRLSSNGNFLLGTTSDTQRLHVYNGNGNGAYKTALFNSNDTTNGTRIVFANTGSTSGRGLGINVGGQTYGPGQDRASFGWYNPDNTFSYLNALTLTADGVMAHGPFASFAYSNLTAFFNVHNGARVNTGGANQFAAPKGGFCDTARYELESSLISYSTSAQQTIQAQNGAQLKISDSRNNWSYYNNLPNYLLGHAATDCINTSNYTLTLKATMTVFLQRSAGWNAVPLSGWELLESDTNIHPGSNSSRLYVKTLAAGSYSGWDSDSAMYFFVL